jgi:hypothetical protein
MSSLAITGVSPALSRARAPATGSPIGPHRDRILREPKPGASGLDDARLRLVRQECVERFR